MRAQSIRLAILLLLSATTAGAELNFFELEAYPAATMPAGELGVESFTTVVAAGRPEDADDDEEDAAAHEHGTLRTSLGLDYGLTERIEVGARFDLRRLNAHDVEVAGGRLRSRVLLCPACAGLVDVGGYLELEAPQGEETDFEVATRLILSRTIGPFDVRVNPIFSLPVVSEERRTVEFGYAAGVYLPIAARWRIGAEAFGSAGQIRAVDSSREQQHFLFATAGLRGIGSCSVVGGPGFGITRASESVVIKLGIDCDL
jgi:hypothetical protein